MQRTITIQDQILGQLTKDRIPVTVYLVNGFQLRGTLAGYDSFVVVLDSEGRQQMIYKHAVSTITPGRTVPFRMQ